MKDLYDIVRTVCLTEKATLLSEKLNKYVFRVHPSANKLEIKAAVVKLFKKSVLSVNTCNYDVKKKRERTASFGRKANWK